MTITGKYNSSGSENGLLPGGNERSSQNLWTNINKLINSSNFEKRIQYFQSSRSHGPCLKMRTDINKMGKEKAVLQCRNKIRNLQHIYMNAKENNTKTGSSSTFRHHFHDFDKVLCCRAVVNMAERIELGQVCRNTDVSVFTFSDTSHCRQSKEYRGQMFMVYRFLSWKTKKCYTEDVFKTSSRRLQYVFTKTNVCWVVRNCLLTLLPLFSRYCKDLITQFAQINLVKKITYHT